MKKIFSGMWQYGSKIRHKFNPAIRFYLKRMAYDRFMIDNFSIVGDSCLGSIVYIIHIIIINIIIPITR